MTTPGEIGREAGKEEGCLTELPEEVSEGVAISLNSIGWLLASEDVFERNELRRLLEDRQAHDGWELIEVAVPEVKVRQVAGFDERQTTDCWISPWTAEFFHNLNETAVNLVLNCDSNASDQLRTRTEHVQGKKCDQMSNVSSLDMITEPDLVLKPGTQFVSWYLQRLVVNNKANDFVERYCQVFIGMVTSIANVTAIERSNSLAEVLDVLANIHLLVTVDLCAVHVQRTTFQTNIVIYEVWAVLSCET